ncbi:hypothetical protein [Paenibacillus sp. FSL H7-0331]|uniref:hypothetical protein n=1 Tax=Paenibacillus sp. FSL H7-0331 TaxID=1920421 RepID=UPI0015C2D7DD|nr:hypothetical protein [Paenibacillus sp. FSL H7-0331]
MAISSVVEHSTFNRAILKKQNKALDRKLQWALVLTLQAGSVVGGYRSGRIADRTVDEVKRLTG